MIAKSRLTTIALIVGTFGSYSALAAEVIKKISQKLGRVIVASCDRCEGVAQMRDDANRWLSSRRVMAGTVEWYSNDLGAADFEALGKAISDTDFLTWREIYARQDVHLWAQAIRLGTRLGLRIRDSGGSVLIQELLGEKLFSANIDDHAITLLDVRVSPLIGIAPSSVFVHLLTATLPDHAEASRLCRGYLADVHAGGRHLMCTIGADDIRPYDNQYLYINPFHKIVEIPPVTQRYESRTVICSGPTYSDCF